MFWRLLIAAFIICGGFIFGERADAQFGAPVYVAQPVAVSYSGPCDLQTCSFAGGFRAMKASFIGGNAITFKRTSDNTSQTFATQSDGFVSESAITTFCGSANANGCWLTEIFDQTGNGHNWTNPNNSTANTLHQNAIGSRSCADMANVLPSMQTGNISGLGIKTIGVVESNVQSSGNNSYIAEQTFNGGKMLTNNNFTGTGTNQIAASSSFTISPGTLSANPWSIVDVFNGSSSILAANGTSGTGTANGFGSSDGWGVVGHGSGATFAICELWASTTVLNSTQVAAIISNDRASTAWNF